MSQRLKQHIGDHVRHGIPMKWRGAPFAPDGNWALLFTLKENETDADEDALVQKTDQDGITISGDDAIVTLIPIDTRGDAEAEPVVPALTPGTKFWGIVAIHTDGRRRHVAGGTLELIVASSTQDETSIPIYTITPPAPHSMQDQINSADEKTTPADNDRIPITDSADGFSLKWFSWANLKATAKTYFDTLYASIGHNHTGVYDPAGSAAAAQAYAIQRANHTGTQAYTTITGLGDSATRNVGTTAGTVAAGDDSRLSDARTPTAHASTHAAGGDDPLFDQDLNTSDVVQFDHVGANSVAALAGSFDEIRSLRPGFPPAFPDGVTDVVAGNITTFPAAGGEAYTTNSPQPTADPNPHASTHEAGGNDELFDQNLNTTDDVGFNNLALTGTATLPHIHGSIAGNLYIHVRNTSGGPLSRGTPVYITGNVGDTDRVTVAAADNTNTAKMPAVGLLGEDLSNNGDGNAVIIGELTAANTNSYTVHQELYVGVGVLTGTKPTTGEIQPAGVVARVQSNTGVIVVNMQGRRTRDEAFAPALGEDDNYVTDAEKTVIENTSGTNTGDQDLTGLVPYTGATGNVDLGANGLQAAQLSSVGEPFYIDLVGHSLNDSGTKRVDWENSQLNSGNGFTNDLSVDWANRRLIAADGETLMLDWSDSSNTGIIDIKGNHFMDVNNLADATDIPSVYVNSRYLSDAAGQQSLDWANRQLTGSGGTQIIADWNNADALELPLGAKASGGSPCTFPAGGGMLALITDVPEAPAGYNTIRNMVILGL